MRVTLTDDGLSLTEEQLLTLNRRLSDGRLLVHVHEFMGITPKLATLVGGYLEVVGVARLYTLLYHRCSEAFVAAVPFTDGLPKFPRACPECGEELTSSEAVDFGIAFRLTEPTELYRAKDS